MYCNSGLRLTNKPMLITMASVRIDFVVVLNAVYFIPLPHKMFLLKSNIRLKYSYKISFSTSVVVIIYIKISITSQT